MTSRHLEHSIFGEEQAPPQPETRAGRRAMRQRPRRRRGKRLLTLLIVLGLVFGCGYVAIHFLGATVSSLFDSGDYPGPGDGEVTVTVAAGDTGGNIARTLVQAEVVKTSKAYVEVSSENPQKAAAIQPGKYQLKKHMKAADAFVVLADPKSRQSGKGILIKEGMWASEVYATLSKATGIPVSDYQKVADNPANLGLPAGANGKVEGFLFPSTYQFDKGASAEDQMREMVKLANDEIAKANIPADQVRRVMTIASIIEGEVNGDADRGKVARVIENRLASSGETKGLLQMDSTVKYLVQKHGGAGLTKQELATESPYNTRLRAGLPPGPIGNPGAKSIEAAMHPTPGPWVYFVTVDPSTGRTEFATTLSEHGKLVQEFQQWCRSNPGKC